MKYFNEHRRRLSKEHSVIGTRATLYCEGSKLSLPNTSGAGFEKIEIHGKTEQKQYQGYNLFDKNANYLNAYFDKTTTTLTENILNRVYSVKCEPGTQYTLSLSNEILKDFTTIGYVNDIPAITTQVYEIYLFNRSQKEYYTITTGSQAQYIVIRLRNLVGNVTYPWEDLLENIQLEKGSTVTEHEPYVGGIPSPSPSYPQPINNTLASVSCNDSVVNTDIQLCGIGEYKDKLTIDSINKTIVKHSAVELYTFTGYESISEETSGESKAYIVDLLSAREMDTKYYCTHFSVYDGNYTAFEDIVEIIDDKAWFYNPTIDLVALLKTGEVQIAYVKASSDDKGENVTDAARELINFTTPYKQNALLEVDGASSIKATYYSCENEDKLSLTVNYTDGDGNALLDSNTYNIRENSRYTVIAPGIEGYEPLQTEYEGYLTKDDEITIAYKEKK